MSQERNMNYRILFSGLLLVVLLSCGDKQQVKQKQPDDLQGAMITAIKGKVELINRDGSKKDISGIAPNTKEALLIPGQGLSTAKDSSVDLSFTNGIQFRIGASTQINLDSAKILSGENFSQVLLDLNKGKVFVKSPKLSKGSYITVTSPTAVAAVRGTEFLTKTEGTKSSTMVKEGSVSVSDDELNKSEVVNQDQKAEVNENGKVEVKPLNDADKNELADVGNSIASITENGKKEIESILQNFEEQKKLILQTIEEQKRSNEALIKGQKESDQELLKEQIRKDRETLEAIKSQAKAEKDSQLEKGKADADAIKSNSQSDMSKIKENKPVDSQSGAKSELERIKKPQ